MKLQLEIALEAFDIRHSGLDPESRISFWTPAFAGMTTRICTKFHPQLPGLNLRELLNKDDWKAEQGD
jgi:hypothetical protein